jgi:hypothetical protein
LTARSVRHRCASSPCDRSGGCDLTCLHLRTHAADRAPDRQGCRFATRYLTTHKGSVRCARFSFDGTYRTGRV